MAPVRRVVDHTYHDYSSIGPGDEEPGTQNSLPTFVRGLRVSSCQATESTQGEALPYAVTSSSASHQCVSSMQHAARPRARGTDWNFTAKLHYVLSSPNFSDVITWMPHGRSFRVLNPKAFIDRTKPDIFTQAKFASFQRQLNFWGFKLLTNERHAGEYYHEMFLQGMPHLTKFMRRSSKSGEGKLMSNPDNEPAFYAISEEFLLPCLWPSIQNSIPGPIMSNNHSSQELAPAIDYSYDEVFEIPAARPSDQRPISNDRDEMNGIASLSWPKQRFSPESMRSCRKSSKSEMYSEAMPPHQMEHPNNHQAFIGGMFPAAGTYASFPPYDGRSNSHASTTGFSESYSCPSAQANNDANDRVYYKKISTQEDKKKTQWLGIHETSTPTRPVHDGNCKISANEEQNNARSSLMDTNTDSALMCSSPDFADDESDFSVTGSMFDEDLGDLTRTFDS